MVPITAIPIREPRRLELQTQDWITAGTLREAKDSGATFAVIATDSWRHVSDTEEALRLGLHVLVEKPMALSAAEGRHLPRLAADRGLTLAVGCPLRFDPGLVAVRQRIGEIGEVHAVRIECRSYLPDWRARRDYRETYSAHATEGGVLRDLIHEIDYALWLFGIPMRVFGTLRNTGRLGIQSEEIAEGFWSVKEGTHVSLGLDYLSRPARRSLSVHGDRGGIEYDFLTRQLKLQKEGALVEKVPFSIAASDIYISQMNEFLDIISGGRPRLLATAEDGVNALAVCDAWRDSASTGKNQRVIM